MAYQNVNGWVVTPYGNFPSKEAMQAWIDTLSSDEKEEAQAYFNQNIQKTLSANHSITNVYNISDNGLFYFMLLAMWKSGDKGKEIVGKLLEGIVKHTGEAVRAYAAAAKTDNNKIEQYGCSKIVAQYLARFGMITPEQYLNFDTTLTWITVADISLTVSDQVTDMVGQVFGGSRKR